MTGFRHPQEASASQVLPRASWSTLLMYARRVHCAWHHGCLMQLAGFDSLLKLYQLPDLPDLRARDPAGLR